MQHLKKFNTFILENIQYNNIISQSKYNDILNKVKGKLKIKPINGYELTYSDFKKFVSDYNSNIIKNEIDLIYNKHKKDIDLLVDTLNESFGIKNILILATIFILGLGCSNIILAQNKTINSINLDIEPKIANINYIKSIMDYPKQAKFLNIDGVVKVKLLIDEQGKVIDNVIIDSPHQSMSNEVNNIIDKLEFSPGIKENNPVKCWVVFSFKFKLD